MSTAAVAASLPPPASSQFVTPSFNTLPVPFAIVTSEEEEDEESESYLSDTSYGSKKSSRGCRQSIGSTIADLLYETFDSEDESELRNLDWDDLEEDDPIGDDDLSYAEYEELLCGLQTMRRGDEEAESDLLGEEEEEEDDDKKTVVVTTELQEEEERERQRSAAARSLSSQLRKIMRGGANIATSPQGEFGTVDELILGTAASSSAASHSERDAKSFSNSDRDSSNRPDSDETLFKLSPPLPFRSSEDQQEEFKVRPVFEEEAREEDTAANIWPEADLSLGSTSDEQPTNRRFNSEANLSPFGSLPNSDYGPQFELRHSTSKSRLTDFWQESLLRCDGGGSAPSSSPSPLAAFKPFSSSPSKRISHFVDLTRRAAADRNS